MRSAIATAAVVALAAPIVVYAEGPRSSCGVRGAPQGPIPDMRALNARESAEFVARLRMRDLYFREAEAKSHKNLLAQGFRPGNRYEVYVLINEKRAKTFWRSLWEMFVAPAHADDAFSGDGGYLVWSEWDDFNDDAWTGFLFVDDGTGGTWSIDNQWGAVDVERPVYWTRGELRTRDGFRKDARAGQPTGGGGCYCYTSYPAARCILEQGFWSSRDFCAGAVAGCRARGPWISPSYWQCVGSTCGTAAAVWIIRWARETTYNCRQGI